MTVSCGIVALYSSLVNNCQVEELESLHEGKAFAMNQTSGPLLHWCCCYRGMHIGRILHTTGTWLCTLLYGYRRAYSKMLAHDRVGKKKTLKCNELHSMSTLQCDRHACHVNDVSALLWHESVSRDC